MNCPYCGKEMPPGYIESRDGLGWSETKFPVRALAGAAAELPLGKSVVVYNCRDCQKLVAEYEYPPRP